MNCPYCGTAHPEPAKACRRCASKLPESRCKACKVSIEWESTYCDRCRPENDAEKESCPACGTLNDPEADYCERCGSPMAVITRVVTTGDGGEKLDPWRVYGVETTLVGRDDDLRVLHEMLDEVEASNALRLVLIAGKQGLGKSRLLAEFERRLENSFCNAVILRGVCREEVGGAFAVISRMLRTHFYIPDQAPPEMARRNLVDAVTLLVGERSEPVSRQLGELMGLPFPDKEEITEETVPRQREITAFKAVEAILRADARNNPLLFILDDVHLAPDATLRLLIHLIEALKDSPIFFVLSQLTGARRVIPPRTANIELELAPLSDYEVRRHITDTLRLADSIPDSLVENIVDAALGNPLAVEEILRIFIAEGIIDTRTEPWKIDVDRVDDIEMPTTMEATVEARLAGLTDEERRGLEMASCVGNLFWGKLLRCLDSVRLNANGELSEPWLALGADHRRPIDDVLESLERKDIIRRQPESRIPGEEEFFFKHRLERETLYRGLPPRVRQRYHRLVAQWMDNAVDSNSDGAAEFIARHYAQARCLRRAGEKFLSAGDDALRHHANRKAIELYVEALSCLTDAEINLKMRAFHDLGSVHELLGEHDQAMTYYQDMARYAWLIGDDAKGGAALNKIGRALRGLGRYDKSLEVFSRALHLFRKVEDERGVASTLDDLGKIHWIRGHQARALEYYLAALEMRRSLEDKRSIALSLSHIGSLKLERGDLRDAMVYFREALDLRKASKDRQGTASSYNDLAALCAEQGKYEKALPLYDEALVIAREIGFRGLEAAVLNNRGEALIALKRRPEARDHLLKARELAIQIGQRRVIFDTLRNLAKVAVSEANRKRALELIADALDIATELDSRTLIALAELTRAEVHAEYIFDPSLKEESAQEATSAFTRAIDFLTETGNDVHLANAMAAFGNFLVESGEVDDGRQNLEDAASIYARLKMSKHLGDTKKVLARI